MTQTPNPQTHRQPSRRLITSSCVPPVGRPCNDGRSFIQQALFPGDAAPLDGRQRNGITGDTTELDSKEATGRFRRPQFRLPGDRKTRPFDGSSGPFACAFPHPPSYRSGMKDLHNPPHLASWGKVTPTAPMKCVGPHQLFCLKPQMRVESQHPA